jgi:hypothetical protein
LGGGGGGPGLIVKTQNHPPPPPPPARAPATRAPAYLSNSNLVIRLHAALARGLENKNGWGYLEFHLRTYRTWLADKIARFFLMQYDTWQH